MLFYTRFYLETVMNHICNRPSDMLAVILNLKYIRLSKTYYFNMFNDALKIEIASYIVVNIKWSLGN